MFLKYLVWIDCTKENNFGVTELEIKFIEREKRFNEFSSVLIELLKYHKPKKTRKNEYFREKTKNYYLLTRTTMFD